ncbi:DUF2326 domain-containing protein [Agrobacterium tumefaciens]|nr:DUF2326 domain-containing protein [Agrobacterium tumefaciens]
MLQLKKLYSEPAAFDPVEFTSGLNVILGERSLKSDKNNGVGKSLSIEFINFALLKRKSESRVSKIPKSVFPDDTMVCLDFRIGDVDYTIRRSIKESEQPRIASQGSTTTFAKADDALKFLGTKLFASQEGKHPSLRQLLGPLIRDEGSEFKSLVACFDTRLRVPDDYTPHLYLFGVELDLYRAVRNIFAEIDAVAEESKRVRDSVKLLTKKDIEDARSDLNALSDEVAKINRSIEKLENTAGYDLVRDQILEIEKDIEELRRRRNILNRKLVKLRPISSEYHLDNDEVGAFYDQMKAGLGEMIVRELTEVIGFKNKIEEFQNHLLNERSSTLQAEVADVTKTIDGLDERYREYLSVIDRDGSLKNLKQTYAAAQKLADELGQLKSFLGRYDKLTLDRQKLKIEKDTKLLELNEDILEKNLTIKSFEETVLAAHEFIQGNRKASFELRTTPRKQIVDLHMRIDDDGSHSVDREKVFIYDICLLLNEHTRRRHPGLLIHDNIFEVDEDTLLRSLAFVVANTASSKDQYIVTLNADRLATAEGQAWFETLEDCVVARYTKANKFLKQDYQELK